MMGLQTVYDVLSIIRDDTKCTFVSETASPVEEVEYNIKSSNLDWLCMVPSLPGIEWEHAS